MRKILIFICVSVFLGIGISACSEKVGGREPMADFESKAREIMNREIKKAIDAIDSAAEKRLQSNVSQTDSTMQNAKKDFKQYVETEIGRATKQLEEQTKQLEGKAQGGLIIAIVAFLCSIVVVIIVIYLLVEKKRVQKAETNPYALGCDQKQWIKECVKDCIGTPLSTDKVNVLRAQDVEHIVHNYCYDDNFKAYVKTVVAEVLQEKDFRMLTNDQEPNRSGSSEQPERMTNKGVGCILFARDSRTKMLEATGKDYQKGKSLYKLILESPESSTAVVDLCIGEEGAEERILGRDSAYLGEACELSRKTNSPKKVKVREKGLAEKRDNNTWEVIKQIKVEFE